LPAPATFHALSLRALARAPKFPPIPKSPTSGASDTPQNKKNQKLLKPLSKITFFETYVLRTASHSRSAIFDPNFGASTPISHRDLKVRPI
jgi:hypothetical protein